MPVPQHRSVRWCSRGGFWDLHCYVPQLPVDCLGGEKGVFSVCGKSVRYPHVAGTEHLTGQCVEGRVGSGSQSRARVIMVGCEGCKGVGQVLALHLQLAAERTWVPSLLSPLYVQSVTPVQGMVTHTSRVVCLPQRV